MIGLNFSKRRDMSLISRTSYVTSNSWQSIKICRIMSLIFILLNHMLFIGNDWKAQQRQNSSFVCQMSNIYLPSQYLHQFILSSVHLSSSKIKSVVFVGIFRILKGRRKNTFSVGFLNASIDSSKVRILNCLWIYSQTCGLICDAAYWELQAP